ncbi:ROK family protein [Occultella gossypii]|uniref:ROK family protein n=1 Tax=Occultella gossypii TaxID=2800820 RepID=A0ABS7SH46_9MICO|nr:ROK family protein [Occultella gossypii]MBZ2199475.1 ROK family protein [Occultella gossypii]
MGETRRSTAAPAGLSSVLALLRDGVPRSRAELVELTGHARSTIAQRVDLLLKSGLLTHGGAASSTGGRPPETFAFAPASRIVLAADLGAAHLQMAVTDLGGTILAQRREVAAISDGPEAVLARVCALGIELLDEVSRPRRDLVGVGVGVPGPVEHETGRPRNPPIMPGWDGADIPGVLAASFRTPVLVDNDVNLMAAGEHWRLYADVDDLVFVKVATGIGAGIITAGRVYRGAQGAAGDLGHIAVPGGEPVACTCGNTGCLEALASRGAVRRAWLAAGRSAEEAGGVSALIATGDTLALDLTWRAGRDIGSVLAGTVSLLNPSVVVIGGSMAMDNPVLIEAISDVILTRSLALATRDLRIVGTGTGSQAAVLGASRMVADHVLSDEAIESLLA